MKAHIEPKSKECPFCGASTYEVMSGTGVKCIRCTNCLLYTSDAADE